MQSVTVYDTSTEMTFYVIPDPYQQFFIVRDKFNFFLVPTDCTFQPSNFEELEQFIFSFNKYHNIELSKISFDGTTLAFLYTLLLNPIIPNEINVESTRLKLIQGYPQDDSQIVPSS